MKLDYFKSDACQPYGSTCEACRRTGAEGQEYRRRLGVAFALPVLDFPCPHEIPWGWKKSSIPIGDAIARITHAAGIPKCGQCEEDQKKLNAAGDAVAGAAAKVVQAAKNVITLKRSK